MGLRDILALGEWAEKRRCCFFSMNREIKGEKILKNRFEFPKVRLKSGLGTRNWWHEFRQRRPMRHDFWVFRDSQVVKNAEIATKNYIMQNIGGFSRGFVL